MKKITLLLSLICILTLIVGSESSYAITNDKFSEKEIKERIIVAEETMKQDGIDENTKTLLLNKISSGKKLDSESEIIKPLFVKTYSEDAYNVKKEIYPDQSYIITKVTNIQPIIEANANLQSWNAYIAESGTTISSTSYHTSIAGARVMKSYGAFWAAYKFDYTMVKQGASRIDRVYGQNSMAGGGTMSLSSPSIIKQTDEYNTPARAEMGFNFSGYGSVGSYSGVVGITVTRTGVNAY